MSVIDTGFNGNTQDMLNWYTVNATYPTFTSNIYNDPGIHFVRNYNPTEFNANVYAGNILPLAHNTYSLGDENNIWQSLWVGNGTVHVGGATISSAGSALVIPGEIKVASISQKVSTSGGTTITLTQGSAFTPKQGDLITITNNGAYSASISLYAGTGNQTYKTIGRNQSQSWTLDSDVNNGQNMYIFSGNFSYTYLSMNFYNYGGVLSISSDGGSSSITVTWTSYSAGAVINFPTITSTTVSATTLNSTNTNTTNLNGISGSSTPITIASSVNFTHQASGETFNNPPYGEYPIYVSGYYYDYGSYNFISIACDQQVLSAGYANYSDVRIKKNIVDVDDDMALNYIRQIEPKTYQYIDYKTKGTSNVFGFIAQQIANVLPYATSLIRDFIPDVYTFANCIPGSNNITKLVFSSNIYTYDLSANNYIKLIDSSNNLVYANITVIEDANIYIDKFLQCSNIFVYGKLVNNFVSLNKDAIFTVGISAIQDLDKITSNTNVSVTSLQSTVQTMQSQIDALTARVTALENK